MIQVVLCTVPQNIAKSMAMSLIKQKTCACINIVPKVDSIYLAQDELIQDSESLLIIKTTQDSLSKLMQQINKEHPYSIVEILSLAVDKGDSQYLDWVVQSVLA